ncbi:hypothetical protein I5M32_13005 [Pedobacter sp. SD-b]|uniref:DUF6922 domain-containing protein n=1 Tax=Pedobacter segetis TaxID=2793069 RepID=A0ABS1BLW3_9SPHI|nr:hypothetical protein [Pedobacter segetis]MBK0383880.1 hypothetical protein [Pedobacter segetis]
MFFDNYIEHPNAKLNNNLLWEYNLSDFDFLKMRNLVVQRVVERGWPDDWYFILNFYGLEEVKKAIKEISYLNDKDMNFVSVIFDIPFIELKCYTKKQLTKQHWNS